MRPWLKLNLSMHLTRFYYQYIPAGKEYPVLCRRLQNEKIGWLKKLVQFARGNFGKEEEEVLLDWNEIAKHYGNFFKSLFSFNCTS